MWRDIEAGCRTEMGRRTEMGSRIEMRGAEVRRGGTSAKMPLLRDSNARAYRSCQG